jgi:hypothetical protein
MLDSPMRRQRPRRQSYVHSRLVETGGKPSHYPIAHFLVGAVFHQPLMMVQSLDQRLRAEEGDIECEVAPVSSLRSLV